MLRSILISFLLAAVAHGGTIRLRDAAMVEPGAAVTLGCVALLEGEDAQRLAPVVLRERSAPAPARGWVEIGVDELRRALEKAGAPMGRLAISGGTCTVRVRAEAAPVVEYPGSAPETSKPVLAADAGPTVRAEVLTALARHYGVDDASLRAVFEGVDAEFLSLPSAGSRVVVSIGSSDGAARAVAQVRLVRGSTIHASRTVRADVEVLRPVLVLLGDVRRKQPIDAVAVTVEERWVAPTSAEVLSSLEGHEGALARARYEAGSLVRRDMLESPVIVRKNELVTVYSVSSGFEIRTKARARREGRLGDVIEFSVEGSKRTFAARIDGPGVAVVQLEWQTQETSER